MASAGCQYLVVAVWIGDPGHVRVGKQEVECDGHEGQVSHQGEVLVVQNFLVQPVREGEPVQSVTDTLKVWVPHTHGQVIIIQALRDKRPRERRVRVCVWPWRSNRTSPLPEKPFRTLHSMRPSVKHDGTSELHFLNQELPQTPHRYASWGVKFRVNKRPRSLHVNSLNSQFDREVKIGHSVTTFLSSWS